jgi:D-amino-acid oxidase
VLVTAPPVAVIGGGVSGITCATVLRLAGIPTVTYVRERPAFGPAESLRSRFATVHAAASIIPHSVSSARATAWTAASQEFFRALAGVPGTGVRRQRHHEVFEQPRPEPDYAAVVDGFAALAPTSAPGAGTPRRPGAASVGGWSLDAYFCDAPAYLPFLYRLYADLGGVVVDRPPTGPAGLRAYLDLGHDVYVNCAGEGAPALLADGADGVTDDPDPPLFRPLADPAGPRYLRGHYLLVDAGDVRVPGAAGPVSYNYTPDPSVYATPSGLPADVYCYPRPGAWVLGGSRQRHDGPIHGSAWPGEELDPGEYEVFRHPGGAAVPIPRAILTLNDALLEHLTAGGLRLAALRGRRPSAFVPGIGYRFQRAVDGDSVRLDVSRVEHAGRRFVVHDYGHGGSGYTLSWGCALDVLEHVTRLTAPAAESAPRHPPAARALSGVLQRLWLADCDENGHRTTAG